MYDYAKENFPFPYTCFCLPEMPFSFFFYLENSYLFFNTEMDYIQPRKIPNDLMEILLSFPCVSWIHVYIYIHVYIFIYIYLYIYIYTHIYKTSLGSNASIFFLHIFLALDFLPQGPYLVHLCALVPITMEIIQCLLSKGEIKEMAQIASIAR